MKRLIVSSLAVALAGAFFVSAQSALPQSGLQTPNQQPGATAKPLPLPGGVQALIPTSLSGTLAFVDEEPVLKVGEVAYLLVMPRFYYYAYVDGFKAGMAVNARGRILRSPDLAKASVGAPGSAAVILFFIPEELSVNGKTYVIVGPQGDSGRNAPPSQPGAAGLAGIPRIPGLPADPSLQGPN